VDAKLTACMHLGPDSGSFARRLRRIPDGEPGPRRLWASFQCPLSRSGVLVSPDPRDAVCKTSVFSLLFPNLSYRGASIPRRSASTS
jgi:hypothetical protein